MKHPKWIITIFGLAVLAMAITRFIGVLAAPNTQIPDLSVYIPIVYKQATPTPSPTLTPTATQMPSPTPWPTSTPIPTGVQVLPNHTWHVTGGYLFVVGEVWNNTGDSADNISFTVNFYDAYRNLVDTIDGYIDLFYALPAGDKTCFQVYLYEPPGWAYYQFEDIIYWVGGLPPPKLTITVAQVIWDPSFKRWLIEGGVRNDEIDIVTSTRVIGTIYNPSNMVAACAGNYTDPSTLLPGKSGSFQIIAHSGEFQTPLYRLQADGWIQP